MRYALQVISVLSVLVMSALLGSCASTSQHVSLPPAPTCRSQQECSVKWAASRTFVLNHAGMRIQTYSTDFMETYNSTGPNFLAAQVNMSPLPGGGYEILAKFGCARTILLNCFADPWKTLADFDYAVSAAGSAPLR